MEEEAAERSVSAAHLRSLDSISWPRPDDYSMSLLHLASDYFDIDDCY